MYHRKYPKNVCEQSWNSFTVLQKPQQLNFINESTNLAFPKSEKIFTFKNPNELKPQLPWGYFWRRMLKLTALITNTVTDSARNRNDVRGISLPFCQHQEVAPGGQTLKPTRLLNHKISFPLNWNNSLTKLPLNNRSAQAPLLSISQLQHHCTPNGQNKAAQSSNRPW
jgi:hypothetical protein